MQNTYQERNVNSAIWRTVTAQSLSRFTPNEPLDLRHALLDVIEWPQVDAGSDVDASEITPPNSKLRELAQRFRPGQAWFEEDDMSM